MIQFSLIPRAASEKTADNECIHCPEDTSATGWVTALDEASWQHGSSRPLQCDTIKLHEDCPYPEIPQEVITRANVFFEPIENRGNSTISQHVNQHISML